MDIGGFNVLRILRIKNHRIQIYNTTFFRIYSARESPNAHKFPVGFRQVRSKSLVEQIPDDAWQVVSAGNGAKGPRLYEWAYLPLTSIMIEHQRGLLVRRRLDKSRELAYYVVFAPRQTKLEEVVRVAGTR